MSPLPCSACTPVNSRVLRFTFKAPIFTLYSILNSTCKCNSTCRVFSPAFLDGQSKEALNFQITIAIAMFISALLSIVVIGFFCVHSRGYFLLPPGL
ncbi:DUF4870 domain-containing protein [Sulfuriflexus sp.]|uniref:DUF4870 domain-containing protein n=1 Tax=Sulfuriflexus sp. TaxID=2015443 RepID=UPI00391F3F25